MINVGIVGAAGYTGQELIDILLSHPEANLTFITSDTYKGEKLAAPFPRFTGRSSLQFEGNDNIKSLAARCDAVFLCVPHKEAMGIVPGALEASNVVFDLSADFRLKDADVYSQWYGVKHVAPELLDKAVYGLPEIHGEKIMSADLIAVPGCYPTSAILGLAPIVGSEWVDRSTVIVTSVSGISGSGRKSGLEYAFTELEGDFFVYGAPNHRHTPEMEQELSALAGASLGITFIPSLLPTARGIYTTITLKMTEPQSAEKILAIYRDFYHDSRFVNVHDSFPKMKWVVGTNGCAISVAVDDKESRLIITSTIDNLVKGASGQAVQCFNTRYGFAEDTGLK